MTDAEIARLAREAGFNVSENVSFADVIFISMLYRFAHLIAAGEREACAAACHEIMDEVLKDDGDYYSGVYRGADDCARKIRARGNEFSKDKVTK